MSYRVYTLFLVLLWLVQAATGVSSPPHELEQQTQSLTWWETTCGCLATSFLAAPRRIEAMLVKENVTDIILKSEQRIMENMNTKMNDMWREMKNMRQEVQNLKQEVKSLKQEVNAKIELLDQKTENSNGKLDAKIARLDQKIDYTKLLLHTRL